jgi:hypothetical protein
MDFDLSRPSSGDLAALLAEPALATSLAEGGAIFLAATSPVRLIYASGSLQTFFGVTRLDSLATRLLESGQGKAGLASLFGQLAPGAPGRLERVRFAFGLRVETVTVLLRRTQAPVSVIIGMVVGARITPPKGGFPPALSAAPPGTIISTIVDPSSARNVAPIPLSFKEMCMSKLSFSRGAI